MGINIPDGNQNKFFGQKVSKPGKNVYNSSDADLIYKNDYNKTTYFGNDGSQIEVGNFVDNNTNGVRIYNNNGQLISQYGQQSDGTTNYEFLNTSGNIISRFGQQTDGTVNLKFFDSSGVGLAQFGNFPDGSTALKVAKAGIEVSTAPDAQLIFNSNQDVFKIVKTGTLFLPHCSYTQTGTNQWLSGFNSSQVAHNLGFTPIIIAVTATSYGQYFPIPYTSGGVGSFNNVSWESVSVSTDGTNVYAQVDATGFSGTLAGTFTFSSNDYTIKYYLLQETAN